MRLLSTLVLIGLFVGCGNNVCHDAGDGNYECVPAPEPTPTPEPTPEPTVAPTPAPKSNPLCTKVMGIDGPGNFLWKPEGDHTSALVVLLPVRFEVPFSALTVKRKSGDSEKLRFTGFSNGDRQTWRGELKGGRYTGVVEAFGGEPAQLCIWEVEKPRMRQD